MLALEELSSYSVVDFIPIGKEVFFRLIERQNAFVWPFHALAIAMLTFIIVRTYRQQFRFVYTVLAFAMMFVGVTFHFRLLNELSWTGQYFAWAFILQGVLLILFEILCWRNWEPKKSAINLARFNFGLGLSLFAAIFYPLIVALSRKTISGLEFFSITPDTTVLFVIGVVFMLPKSNVLLFVIPLCWCLISGFVWFGMEWYLGLVTWLLSALCIFFGAWQMLTKQK